MQFLLNDFLNHSKFLQWNPGRAIGGKRTFIFLKPASSTYFYWYRLQAREPSEEGSAVVNRETAISCPRALNVLQGYTKRYNTINIINN
jgi:hypothetical protein